MKLSPQGYRVAVIGASSLLGKELLAVLEEREFPITRLVTFEADKDEPDLPIVDLQQNAHTTIGDEDVREEDLDFAFLAAPPEATSGLPSFLKVGPDGAGSRSGLQPSAKCAVIDLADAFAGASGRVLSVPSVERLGLDQQTETPIRQDSRLFVSPHPAAIMISSLILRLARRFRIGRAIAQVFQPVSEIGPRAIEELQKQTVNVLSFQKLPQTVFGSQLAFNLLPRLGRQPGGALQEVENRLRQQLREYLPSRAPIPALRLFQAPVFYSLALSLYVELAEPQSCEVLTQALSGGSIRVRRFSQPAPSQVEATGSSNILVDTITPDADHPAGVWLWAVADNLRLAAVNAVEIAENLRSRQRAEHQDPKTQRKSARPET